MKFSEYLLHEKISQSRAARELGKSRTYICDIANGKITPGRKLVQAIFEWSGQRVGWEDFYPGMVATPHESLR